MWGPALNTAISHHYLFIFLIVFQKHFIYITQNILDSICVVTSEAV